MEKILKKDNIIEIKQDEELTRKCMYDVFIHCSLTYNFDGYSFVYNKKVNEKTIYDICGYDTNGIDNHDIEPDGGVIFLVNDKNINEKYLILSSEDKKQDSNGNACERFTKNFNFFYNYVTNNIDINPYVLFFRGSFINDDNTVNKFLHSKIRISLPKTSVIWNVNNTNTSFKCKWNRIYMKRNAFNEEEKYNILLTTAIESIKYYESILK